MKYKKIAKKMKKLFIKDLLNKNKLVRLSKVGER